MTTDISYIAALLPGSFVITYLFLPRIINVVKFKHLMDNPNERSSHSEKVPSLGGIAFFFVLLLGVYFLKPFDTYGVSTSLIPGLLILFLVGLKDDLVVLSPLAKLAAQFTAISFVLWEPAFHIRDLHGFLGIEHISLYVSIPLAAFLMVTIINAFNLIDGIDGLASIVGIIIFSIFAVLFYTLGLYFFFGMSIITIGTLLAFLRFNLSPTKKIFMGDTGSMIIGFMVATATVRLFSVSPETMQALPFQLENLPLIVMSILIVPFFDTTRVFTIRLLNKKGPFSPDRNHIHHLLIDHLKFSHRKASCVIGSVNILFVLVFLFLSTNMSDSGLLAVMALTLSFFVYFFYRIKRTVEKIHHRYTVYMRMRQIIRNTHFW